MTAHKPVSPVGKLLIFLILGPPFLLFLLAGIAILDMVFGFIPCTWDIPGVWHLPTGTTILSCESSQGITDSGYKFTASLPSKEVFPYALRLGFTSDEISLPGDETIEARREAPYMQYSLSWSYGVVTVTYIEF